ncbi:MAG: allantoicase [Xanthomonadales bacterium]|nr:allantoicase [Xanthomonadales bacterium]
MHTTEPDFARCYVNLADAGLGAKALACSDDFFAAMGRMLDPAEPVFVPGRYDDHGKWMDGWESRRKRQAGHDWCVVRLASPGRLHGVELDTRHFTGNYPPSVSLECGLAAAEADPAAIHWQPLLGAVPLQGNGRHWFDLSDVGEVSHVRVNLHPDGGLARLRLYGQPQLPTSDAQFDLAAAQFGGRVVACNNEHFGPASRLLRPGRGTHMGDGWETRRRREPGFDWCIIELACAGIIEAVEVDTAHFKGNFPDRCSIDGASTDLRDPAALMAAAIYWPALLTAQPLQMDQQQHFRSELLPHAAVTHVRFNIHPDGGVSRLRLLGRRA